MEENSKQIINKVTTSYLTIGIYTYNAEVFIEESLNSIQSKFEKNIQLIISDDASTDETVSKINHWIEQNKNRFLEVLFLQTTINKGLVGNLNNSIKYINGEWFKPVSGDDVFPLNCIDKIIGETENYKTAKIILGLCKLFGDTPNQGKTILKQSSIDFLKKNDQIECQIEWLLGGHYFPAPGFLYKTSLIKELNGFETEFPDFEDVPFQLKFLFAGNKISFSNEIFINYRKHDDGLSNFTEFIVHPKFLIVQKLLLRYAKKYGKIKFILNLNWNILFARIILIFGNRNRICQLLEMIRRKFQPKKIFNLIGEINVQKI